MFKPIIKNNIFYGYQWKDDEFTVFFGSKYFQRDLIASEKKSYSWIHLKQVHGNAICETNLSSANNCVADAHWTDVQNLGLLIQTADCIPLFIYDHKYKKSIAVHAGWRGIENQIIPKCILNQTSIDSELSIFIGPCILASHFEVDKDVNELLIQSSPMAKEFSSYKEDTKKYHLDLTKIALNQISTTKRNFKLHSIQIDTYEDLRFSSYRREKGPCRNWSYIMKSNEPCPLFGERP